MNNGYIDNKCPQRALPLRYVTWTRGDISLTEKEAMLHMHGTFDGLWNQDGVVDIKVSCFALVLFE